MSVSFSFTGWFLGFVTKLGKTTKVRRIRNANEMQLKVINESAFMSGMINSELSAKLGN